MTPPQTAAITAPTAPVAGPRPLTGDRQPWYTLAILWIFVLVPFIALVAAVPVFWGWGLTWRDAVLGIIFFNLGGFGITVGFHRHFTHGSFKAKRGLRIALAVAGTFAIEGPVTRWVADHRRHHAFSDKEGDPHSPWRYGATLRGLTKGFVHAHVGWLFDSEQTNRERFAPDLMADRDIRLIDKLFVPIVLVSVFLPVVLGGLWAGSWTGALSAFFWASVIRIGLLHHTTWAINSVCHIVGERPFKTTDKAANFWPLALLSFGESWHNLHHADPTCARHGVLRGQIDTSARLIWIFEKLGWVSDVRWPRADRIAAKKVSPAAGTMNG